ncbi:MAG: hypothetical protein OXI87_06650 [Albidovulum sp.]|nr:hypothetical protein [Albidovulum sp.]MDE0531456.1 hypothetical protein [Albidovulum sp.]
MNSLSATSPGEYDSGFSRRRPDEIMKPYRIGMFFPHRLSFKRVLTRALHREGAKVNRPVWQMDADGFGRAVYTVELGGYPYSLVAISKFLDPQRRTDRVIAEAWDTTFALFDGVPDNRDMQRLEENVPLQESGRFEASELVLSRANKSVRMFEHVAERLANGQQPDCEMIRRIGYLMRTTAVYGNGKFGLADRERIARRTGISGAFQVEMLAIWLIRGFSHDLVEHIAAKRGHSSARLAPHIRRFLGIGNSTGLGMAPFLIGHPILLHNWVFSRETALARVRSIETASRESVSRFRGLLSRGKRHLEEWLVEDEDAMTRIACLRRELDWFADNAAAENPGDGYYWNRLFLISESLSGEFQEFCVSLLLEPHGDLVDELESWSASEIETRLDPAMTAADLLEQLRSNFQWALSVDFDAAESRRHFWYVSEEKLEPRLGDRYRDEGSDLELPIDVAYRIQRLFRTLAESNPAETVAEFLLRCPELRGAVRRAQNLIRYPFCEIRGNLLDGGCRPIDLLRCKLSFFGASKFDPKSDRWIRVALFQGAPTFDSIGDAGADDWLFPVLGDFK